ncbi:unnamed protein product (macronuclear) [Paramecium tetraurelia]|uniref:non-specific serine/threonine protein kinase n=1 Tax=Paramecium tetraurelia TaxID=5888 RepID=A0BFG0_PARTE|nr:uncharacterized protein GSPATT00028312001 [Paramecium tetraurelia]CAK57277.1 unnamed protein product [Paramecium tetraurelia]|eukprot:XP_001424675.1 hypothetical protein (macronuclear) [Paramecium tetraurelia strain d4-2]
MNQQKKTIFTQKKAVYVLEEQLGQGTGGYVYRAYKVYNNQKQYVALKVQSNLNYTEQQTLEILTRQNLNHVVNILDLDSYNNEIIITMDLADGSFQKFWSLSKINNAEEILRYFIQIAKGTLELHQLYLIHRDLKLENVVYQEINNVKHLKLCDTGLIRQQNGMKTMMVGTPYYMPPEQINKQIYDEKTDIWALGMILYEMLSGRTMVRGNSVQEILNNILNLSQASINFQIDQLKINKQQGVNDIKGLLRQMIVKDSKQRVDSQFVVTELERILNIQSLQVQNGQNIMQIVRPEIREQIRLEIQKEFEIKFQQEQDKLAEQQKLDMEQFKNEIMEYYQKQIIEQTIRVQKETEENLKAQQQKELQILQEEYDKKIANCNQQQIEELKYQYQEEKQNIITQMEKNYQIRFQQEAKNKEIELQKEMEIQIQTQLQNRQQISKLLLQEQLKQHYQEEFEQKSRNLAQYQQQLTSIQQNLNRNKINIEMQQKDLIKHSTPNQSQKFLKSISEYKQQLQQMLNQLESINKQLSELEITSDVLSQNQYCNLIEENLQKLEQIKNLYQDLIVPNLVESFIQNWNQLFDDIRREQKQQKIKNEESLLKLQQEDSEKLTKKLQDLFLELKEKLKNVNEMIGALNQKNSEFLQQYETLNQQHSSLYIEFQILQNSIKLAKEDQKLDIIEKQNKQMVHLLDKLKKIQFDLESFISIVQQYKAKEQQMIQDQLQNFIVIIDDWEYKRDQINYQQQSSNLLIELKTQLEERNKELEILKEIKNRIIQLINELKQNKNQNFYKQFSEIEKEFQISTMKLNLIENYYKKEQRRSYLKPKEQKNINSNLRQLFDSVSKRRNDLQNQLQKLQNRCNDNIQQQHIFKQLELIRYICENQKQIIQEIEMCINKFQISNFQSIDEINLENSKITYQIKMFSQNLDPLFESLNEIKKQMTQPEDKYWDNDFQTLKNSFQEIRNQLEDKKKFTTNQMNLSSKSSRIQKNVQKHIRMLFEQNEIQSQLFSQVLKDNKQNEKCLKEKFLKKSQTYIAWAKEQQSRIQEIENQIKQQEQQNTDEFVGKFIKDYKEIASLLEKLNIKISELELQKNRDQFNKYNELAQQYQQKINDLKFEKQQNQSSFQALYFYIQQNQIINCADALFELYCLNRRFQNHLQDQKNYIQKKIENKEQQVEKNVLELSNTQNNLEKIQVCFNILKMKENEFSKVDIFIKSIKNDLLSLKEQFDELDFEQQLKKLHEKIRDLIQDQQKNIQIKNSVKLKSKLRNKNSVKEIQQSILDYIPNSKEMTNSLSKMMQEQRKY